MCGSLPRHSRSGRKGKLSALHLLVIVFSASSGFAFTEEDVSLKAGLTLEA
jgi:hypothetical protein